MKPTLVTAASGKTGHRVARRLAARGVPVRAGSRSGTPPFDWKDPRTWAPALEGAGAAYVAVVPDVAVPGSADTVGRFAAEAAQRGVGRLVLLSGRGESEAQAAERALAAAGVDWTVLRASWFAQNFSEGYLLEGVLSGTVALPAAPIPEPFVDVDDIADVAVAALTEDGHAGRTYELTGPTALTFEQAVAEIARASGRPVRFERIGMDECVAALAADGVPADVIELLRYLFGELFDGRNAQPRPGVEQALGRPARSFTEFARRAAAAGAWSAGRAGYAPAA